MAIFHFSAKTVSRGEGRSSTAAAAYRAGEKIVDERSGEIHDFTRKSGVVDGGVVLPGGNTLARSELWNKVEAKHRRGDAIVAREFELALPAELTDAERIDLVSRYAGELSDKYGVAVDWNIHAPADGELNHHTHVMLSACYVTAEGVMGKKCVELDPIYCKRAAILNPMETQRERWQDLCNEALERAGSDERIDHRTLVAQGITDRLPGVHLGPTGAGMAARGEVSEIELRAKRKAAEFIARIQADAAIAAAAERAQLDVIELRRQLVEANAEAAQPKPRTRNELLAKLEPVQTELAKHQKIISEITLRLPAAQPRAQVEAAKSALASMGKRSDKAQAKAARIQDDLGKLGWWRPFSKARLRRELPLAQQAAGQLAKRLETCKLVAAAQPLDRLESVIADSRAAVTALEQQAMPLQDQLQVLEAARDAKWVADRAEAQEALKAARMADLRAQGAILARHEAAHAQRAAAPAHEQDEDEVHVHAPRC